MTPHDVRAVLASIPAEALDLSRGDASRIFERFDRSAVGAVRFCGTPPWERHPGGDELLYVLEGEFELTVLTAERRIEVALPAGSVFVVPRGLWHRSRPRGTVSVLFVTPTEGGEDSWADDPRT